MEAPAGERSTSSGDRSRARLRNSCALAVAVLALAVGTVSGAGLGTGTVAAAGLDGGDAGVTVVDDCTVIDSPGLYELAADLRGSGDTCLHVRSDDVVLDGNGHAVVGVDPAQNSAGVLVHNGSATEIEQDVEEPSNVTVRDVRVSGWTNGVRTGEFVSDGPTVTLRNVTATDNGAGFVLYGAGRSSLVDLTAADNEGDGVYVWETTFLSARGLTVTDNGGDGLHLGQSVLASNFSGVRATGNDGAGIVVGTSAVDDRITGAYVADNGAAGVVFSDSSGTLLRGATVRDNGGPGIASRFGEGDLVRNATVAGNAVAYDSDDDQPRYGVLAREFRLGNGVTAAFDANVSGLDDADRVPPLPANVTTAGPAANVSVDSGDVRPRATLTFPYDAAVVEDPDALAVWRYANGTWHPVGGASVDVEDGTVTAAVRRGGVVVPVAPAGHPSPTSTVVVDATDAGRPAVYGFLVAGTVEPAGAAEDEEWIRRQTDGRTVVLGTAGDGDGRDAFHVRGTVLAFGRYPTDAGLLLLQDGEDVTGRVLVDPHG